MVLNPNNVLKSSISIYYLVIILDHKNIDNGVYSIIIKL